MLTVGNRLNHESSDASRACRGALFLLGHESGLGFVGRAQNRLAMVVEGACAPPP